MLYMTICMCNASTRYLTFFLQGHGASHSIKHVTIIPQKYKVTLDWLWGNRRQNPRVWVLPNSNGKYLKRFLALQQTRRLGVTCSHVQESSAYYEHGLVAVSSTVRYYTTSCHIHGPSQWSTTPPWFFDRANLFYHLVWRRCKIQFGEWFAAVRDNRYTNVPSPVNKEEKKIKVCFDATVFLVLHVLFRISILSLVQEKLMRILWSMHFRANGHHFWVSIIVTLLFK